MSEIKSLTHCGVLFQEPFTSRGFNNLSKHIDTKITNNNIKFPKEVLKYFEDLRTEENSEWIDKYFEILSDPSNINSVKFDKHHIIPIFTFKDETHTTRNECEKLANLIEGNLIKLSVRNHIKAHFILWKIFQTENSRRPIYILIGKQDVKSFSMEEIDEIAKIIEECRKENKTKEEIREYFNNYQRIWRKSENGKNSEKRYNESKKHKSTIKKYFQSEKGKQTRKEWENTEKGKESIKRSRQKYNKNEKGKKAQFKYRNSENYKQNRKEWENTEKGKESIKRSKEKYSKSEKGKLKRKENSRANREYKNRQCFDPILKEYCTYNALYLRKYNHKELYKNVIVKNCLIIKEVL